MNYRITFDPAVPGDVRTRTLTYNNPAPVPQKKASNLDANGVDPDGDIDAKDDEDDSDCGEANDASREEHLNHVYQAITNENWYQNLSF